MPTHGPRFRVMFAAMGIRERLSRMLGTVDVETRQIAVVDPSTLGVTIPQSNATSLLYAPEQGLASATVFRSVAMIADSVASMPWSTWYPDTNTIVPDQPSIIRRPDPFNQTATTFRQIATSILLFGEAFLWLTAPDRTGRPTVAIPIPNGEITIAWNDTRTRPVYRWRREVVELNRDLIHIKYIDDVRLLHGLGPIQAARYSVDAAVQAERFSQEFYQEGAVPDALLMAPAKLNQGEAEKLRAQWQAGESRGTRVLEGGLKYETVQMSNADAQYIESRQFSVSDIARLFGIPAPLLNASTSGSSTLQYRNQEGLAVEYATFAVQPITERIEAAFAPLVPSTQEIRFDFTRLLRADSSTRFAVYDVALRNGIMTINEVRQIEGLPPLPDGGDIPATGDIIEGGTEPELVEEGVEA